MQLTVVKKNYNNEMHQIRRTEEEGTRHLVEQKNTLAQSPHGTGLPIFALLY